MTNKITTILDLNIMEKYVKKVNNIHTNNIMNTKLSQSKFYLKILDIFYLVEHTNLSITSDIIKSVIKSTYIFNNIVLASCSQVIKAFLKFNIVII